LTIYFSNFNVKDEEMMETNNPQKDSDKEKQKKENQNEKLKDETGKDIAERQQEESLLDDET
jgi:hypothetical protein